MFSCVCLHGDRKPQERRESLDAFKQKKVKFLICTDVAARGLDISGLPFSIRVLPFQSFSPSLFETLLTFIVSLQ